VSPVGSPYTAYNLIIITDEMPESIIPTELLSKGLL